MPDLHLEAHCVALAGLGFARTLFAKGCKANAAATATLLLGEVFIARKREREKSTLVPESRAERERS